MTDQLGINFDAPKGLTMDELRVVQSIRRGRENAISMPALAAICGMKTRVLQDVIKHLIEDHDVLIASATGKNHGYYYPTSREELMAARAQLIHRIVSTAKRLKAIDKTALEEIHGQIGMML